jgi:hypothetical protein
MPYDDDIDFSILSPDDGGDYALQVRDYSPGAGNFSKRSCGHELLVSVPFEKSYPALLKFLGFSEVRGGQLHRSLPLRSSDYDFLWCTKVANSQDLKFLGKFDAADPDQPDGAQYQRTHMRLLFEQLPYALLDDSDIYDDDAGLTEADRYVDWGKYEGGVDSLKIDVGQIKYAEGPPEFLGQPYPGSLSLIYPKGTIRATWYEVPRDWVFNADGVPTSINSCVGRVNSQAFRGYPAGTLFLEPPIFDPYVMNLRQQGGLWTGQPLLFYDVGLIFRHMDPPRFDDSSPYRGHNLVPLPRRSEFVLGTRDGTTGGDGVYLQADFNQIFAKAT